tara:strand:+ start:342 stop:941 length:600 start_codon:yes stop_codon:yes gene_type:complete
MYIYDFIQGLIIGSTLIIAIGPQNLFVINQGLKKSFVLTVVLFCSISDSILIIIGINLSSLIIDINTNTIVILKILGGIWLVFYGLNKIRKIKNIRNIKNNTEIGNNLIKVLITLFLITYANPHVYLDTIILIGSISTNFESQLYFGIGAVLASFIFFFSLGYLSQILSKYIYSNNTWFWIDLIVGILMIAYGLKFIFF